MAEDLQRMKVGNGTSYSQNSDIICSHRFSIRPGNKDLWYLMASVELHSSFHTGCVYLSKVCGEGQRLLLCIPGFIFRFT